MDPLRQGTAIRALSLDQLTLRSVKYFVLAAVPWHHDLLKPLSNTLPLAGFLSTMQMAEAVADFQSKLRSMGLAEDPLVRKEEKYPRTVDFSPNGELGKCLLFRQCSPKLETSQ